MKEAEGAGGYAKEISEDAQRKAHEHLRRLVSEADVVITTAQIPGRPAPRLVTDDMVDAMRAGAVIVDLAADSGGNCSRTRAGEVVQSNGVVIHGPVEVAATMPLHASQMYSRNVVALLQHLVKDGQVSIDTADEITSGCMVTHGGEVVHGGARAALGIAAT